MNNAKLHGNRLSSFFFLAKGWIRKMDAQCDFVFFPPSPDPGKDYGLPFTYKDINPMIPIYPIYTGTSIPAIFKITIAVLTSSRR